MGIYYGSVATVGVAVELDEICGEAYDLDSILAPLKLAPGDYVYDGLNEAIGEECIVLGECAVLIGACGYDEPPTHCPLVLGVIVGYGEGSKGGGLMSGVDPASVGRAVEAVNAAIEGTRFAGRDVRLFIGSTVY